MFEHSSSPLLDINPWKLVGPEKLRPQILNESHDEWQSGYLGSEKTHARISEYYYWPGLHVSGSESRIGLRRKTA